jgi:hypothetical protein
MDDNGDKANSFLGLMHLISRYVNGRVEPMGKIVNLNFIG